MLGYSGEMTENGDNLKHVVMFSGGIGSWAAAKMVAARHGTDDLYLVFTDVKGNAESSHIGEDEDTYRFLEDSVKNIGGTYVYLNEGRDIWEVFKDKKFLGNSRLAHCSFELKQKPARKWLDENCDPEDTVVYVGIDWTETHRLPAIVKNYKPYTARAPLAEPFYHRESKMYFDKPELIEWAKSEGLEPPRLYSLGFSHNNCGGGCVRAGQAQFKKLLEIMPERFAMWEAKEQEVIEHLGKEVSILTDMKDGVKRSLPLIELRRRVEEKTQLVDELDIGGCGCFFEEDERGEQ
jgi:hypothetical protein